MNLKTVLIALMVLFVSSGCVSILDKDKISGLQEMAVWKAEAESLVKESKKCKKDYNNARNQIDAYINTTLDTQIGQLETQYFSKIDLSKDKLPSEVSKSVSTFLECAKAKEPFQKKALLETVIASEITKEVLDWCNAQIKEARKNSAKALREKLKTLDWEKWESFHK